MGSRARSTRCSTCCTAGSTSARWSSTSPADTAKVRDRHAAATLPTGVDQAHHGRMAQTTAPHVTVRGAAVQVGEFVVGTAAAYVAVGAAWAVTAAIWAPLLVAAALVAFAVAVELRFGAKATGLVAGILPTAVVTAGLLATLTLVLARLSS